MKLAGSGDGSGVGAEWPLDHHRFISARLFVTKSSNCYIELVPVEFVPSSVRIGNLSTAIINDANEERASDAVSVR